MIFSGSEPRSSAFVKADRADVISPAIQLVKILPISLSPAWPSIAETLVAVMVSAVIAAAWSSNDSESRTDPSAALAII